MTCAGTSKTDMELVVDSQAVTLSGGRCRRCVHALRHGAGRSRQRFRARRTEDARLRPEHGREGPLLASLLASPRPLALPPLVPSSRLVVADTYERLQYKPASRRSCRGSQRGAGLLFGEAAIAQATLNRAAFHTISTEPTGAAETCGR